MKRSKLKVVIAPNALKESLSAKSAASAIRAGTLKAFPGAETIISPLADGGDGMLNAFLSIRKADIIRTRAFDPHFKKIPVKYAVLDNQTALIEMSLVSGLNLNPAGKRNAMTASTYGLGQVITHAEKRGCSKFIIGIGGSATTDGGAGLAQAAGFGLFKKNGRPVSPGGTGLSELAEIRAEPAAGKWKNCFFKIACDVSNPLLGKNGAARVFGPQKGVSESETGILDANLKILADKIEKNLKKAFRKYPGTGAAGGTGFVFKTLFGAELISGADLILSETGFTDKCKGADLIISAEGALDGQSAQGKLISAICKTGKKLNIPVIALTGSLGPGWRNLYRQGLTSAFAIAPGPVSIRDSMKNAAPFITDAACNAVKLFCSA